MLIVAAVGLAWIGAGSMRPIVTQSGLQFRTLKAGHGAPIARVDAAALDYILTSDDGTVFDSNEAHGGQPMPFTMDGIYPGFAEAMARMQEGGEYRFSMPERLAWGTKAPPPQGWPKGSLVTFEVRVRKIARGEAAALQQLQAQQLQAQMQQQEQQQSQPPQ